MKIVILAPALAELDEAAIYYTEHASPRITHAFLNEFEHARKRLAEYPEIGTPLSQRHRILPLRRFPCSVIYRSRPRPSLSTPSPTRPARVLAAAQRNT